MENATQRITQRTSPRRVLQEASVHRVLRQHNVSDNTPSYKDIFDTGEMRVLVEVKHFNIIQLDVEILVDALQGTADSDVVLEFDDNGVVGEGFKETGDRNQMSPLL